MPSSHAHQSSRTRDQDVDESDQALRDVRLRAVHERRLSPPSRGPSPCRLAGRTRSSPATSTRSTASTASPGSTRRRRCDAEDGRGLAARERWQRRRSTRRAGAHREAHREDDTHVDAQSGASSVPPDARDELFRDVVVVELHVHAQGSRGRYAVWRARSGVVRRRERPVGTWDRSSSISMTAPRRRGGTTRARRRRCTGSGEVVAGGALRFGVVVAGIVEVASPRSGSSCLVERRRERLQLRLETGSSAAPWTTSAPCCPDRGTARRSSRPAPS